jgi:hypothetical protein
MNTDQIDQLARALPVELRFFDSYSRETIRWLEERLKAPVHDWITQQIPVLAQAVIQQPEEEAIRLELFENLKGPSGEPVHWLILFGLGITGKNMIMIWIGPPEEVAKRTKMFIGAFGPKLSTFDPSTFSSFGSS